MLREASGDPDAEDFDFATCNTDGTFHFTNVPDGSWRITVFDQWNDLLVDGLSFPVAVVGGKAFDMGDVPMQQWRTNLATRTFLDVGSGPGSAGYHDGISNVDGSGNPVEPGLPLVPTNIRFRDGSFSNFNNTDLNGFAGFNEVFPLFSWYVVEADTTRYKQTGVHVVYDAGGPPDKTPGGGNSRYRREPRQYAGIFHGAPADESPRSRSNLLQRCRLHQSLGDQPLHWPH